MLTMSVSATEWPHRVFLFLVLTTMSVFTLTLSNKQIGHISTMSLCSALLIFASSPFVIVVNIYLLKTQKTYCSH